MAEDVRVAVLVVDALPVVLPVTLGEPVPVPLSVAAAVTEAEPDAVTLPLLVPVGEIVHAAVALLV